MSERTPCNFCTLNRIKAEAKKKGKEVTVLADLSSGTLGGYNIYVHPKKIDIRRLTTDKRKKYDAGVWLLAISEACCC